PHCDGSLCSKSCSRSSPFRRFIGRENSRLEECYMHCVKAVFSEMRRSIPTHFQSSMKRTPPGHPPADVGSWHPAANFDDAPHQTVPALNCPSDRDLGQCLPTLSARLAVSKSAATHCRKEHSPCRGYGLTYCDVHHKRITNAGTVLLGRAVGGMKGGKGFFATSP